MADWRISALGTLAHLGAFAFIACTRPNPEVCCTSADDCASLGVTDERPCGAGLACLDHKCVVASCSTEGCVASLPVCNLVADACDGCTEAAQCARFPGMQVCNVADGACVECLTSPDCPATKPICDSGSCRGCSLDADCPSGACAADASCVPEPAIVYVASNGTDSGACERSMPCQSLQHAVATTTATRNHVVVAAGTYVGRTLVSTAQTSAATIAVHGDGATLRSPAGGENPTLDVVDIEARITGFTFDGASLGPAIQSGTAGTTLERIIIRDHATGVVALSMTTIRDSEIRATSTGIQIGGSGGAHLAIERSAILSDFRAIRDVSPGATMELTNTLVVGTASPAFIIPFASGSIRFSTIVTTTSGTGTAPRVLQCGSGLSISSSIVWAATSTTVPISGGCTVTTSIVGPIGIAGALSSDPKFVNVSIQDFHLTATSPAKDLVDAGPALDFERDPRPNGVRFDIGADELR